VKTIITPAIIATDLQKKYGSLTALDGVSFTVGKGSIFGLLGPNGAGKTTTIRIMTGLTKPESGNVSILGCDIAKDTIRAKKKIGVVPETSNIYEEMTAEQNLIFAAELYGVPSKERRKRAIQLL
jgi:ABC-2 type transport system ATP-binding protein